MSGASVTSNRSQRSMQSHQSSRSKRSLPQAAAATTMAAVPSSDASLRSTSSRSSRMSASSKASSKRSRPLPPPESGIPPNSPSVASSGASVASTASSSVRSTHSTHSTQSNQSKRSNRSFRSTSTSKTVRSTRGARSASLLSQGLDLLHGPADGTTATRRHARYCANDGRSSTTPSSSLRQAIRLFGAALSSYQANEYGNPPEGGTEERIERTLARLHAHRSEALYRLGAHAAAEADARKALECERIAGCKRTLLSALSGNAADADFERDGRVDPYHSHHPSANPLLLHPERGPALRAKLLHLLGLSLLRRGLTSEHGARDAFDSCVDVAEKALDDAEEFTLSERRACPSHGEAEALLKEIVAHARWETGRLERLEALTTRWEHDARGRRFGVKDVEEALEIAPRSVSFMEEYVRYLAGRKRWFEVANRCERWAAETAAMEGVFAREKGGMATRENSDGAFLTEGDPFPGVPPLEDLTEDFFGNQDNKDGVPFYLRTLSDVGAKDAAFRLPKQIVPYYLRALRLEERYGAAIRALNALLEFHAHFEKEQEYMKYFVDRTILLKEKDKLERTIKFKEEGDGLFRDGYFERAAGMYGECLVIDREPDSAATAPAATRFGDVHGTQPFAKPAEAGGRLHAVLHSNRAACFSSLGRYDDAIAECTHALDIHNMYMKAMLRRARCYLKVGEEEKAKADFRKWITFANGAVSLPFPPMGQGPACFFDMPANVSREELGKVKKEMEDVGAVSGGGGGGGAGGVRGAVVRGGATVDEDGQDGSHGGGRISLKKRLSKRRSSKKLNGGASMDTNAFPSGGDGSNYARNNNDGKSRSTKAGGIVMGFFRGISDFFESIGFPACMKKDVEEEVVTGNVSDPRSMGSVPPPMPPPPVPLPQRNNLYDASTVRSRSPQGSVRSNTSRSQQSRSQSRRRSSPHSNGPLRSSLKKDPPATPPTLIRHRPPFEHPLDPPLEINADKDYYEVLGLKESASASDIKQAYFKLAKENHPDRNDSQAARTKFDEVKSAYDILGNKEKKKLYDRKRTGGLDP